MKKILIGTGNPSKVEMMKDLLKGLNLEIISAKDLNIPAPEENAISFEQEAIQKAKYYFEKSGVPAIVDDGGFEIETLNGEPGIHSNRWIGRKMTDEEIISEVFKRMQGKSNRKAKHSIVMALATPFGVFTSSGEVAGVIPEEPSQKRYPNFPYRSVLFLPNYNKYWGDITEEEEKILSHRKHAIEKLSDVLKQLSQPSS